MTDLGELVGRVDERTLLIDLLQRLTRRESAGALLVGEAGIGKSALAQWVTEQAGQAGVSVLTGRALPLTFERALFPFLDALDALDTPGEVSTGRQLVEASLGDPANLVAQRIVDKLDELANVRPLLLVIEDLHWADRSTLTLVHHLLSRSRGGVAVVATARHHGKLTGGGTLDDLLAALDSGVVPLGPLDAVNVELLAERRFGCPPGARLASLLHEADGNPLLIDALLEGLSSDGVVVVHDQRADLVGTFTPSPTTEIERRITSLRPSVRRLVQVAAVLSPYVRVDAVAELASCRSMEVVEGFDEAVAAGVLATGEHGIGFRHDLYRSAALATLPTTAHDALHLEAARVLTTLGASGLQVAEHYALGARPGNREAIAKLSDVAAQVVGLDPAVAMRLTDVALELGAGATADLDLRCTRVRALAGCGRSAEAEMLGRALLRESLAPAVEAKLRRELALAAVVEGRAGDAAVSMRRVLDLVSDEQAVARARAELAFAEMLALDAIAAHADASQAIIAGVDAGDLTTCVAAYSVLCWLGLWQLDIAGARTSARELLRLTTGVGGEWLVYQPGLSAAAVLFEVGEREESRRALTAARRAVVDAGLAWATPAYDALDATMALRDGDVRRVNERATRALEGTELVDGFGVEVWSRSLLARVALCTGRADEAEEHLAAADLAVANGRAQFGLDHLIVAQANLAETNGDMAGSLQLLAEGWDLLSALGVLHGRQTLAAPLARAAALLGDEQRLTSIRQELGSVPSMVPAFETDRCRVELWTRPDATRAAAAVNAARNGDRLLDLLGTLLDVAELGRRSAGLAAVGEASSREAIALLAELGIITDGRLLPGDGPATRRAAKQRRPRFGPDSLTDAEVRVAALVSEGLTNVEIAARLLVSRRTIDTHVLAVYRKLEVRSRVELTRAVLGAGRPG